MTDVAKGSATANQPGLNRADYNGSKSTFCNGCGHNAIANVIVGAAYDLSLDMTRVAKFSGIGCSSKSPTYFLGRSHGINGLHGRMPSLATGATTVNSDLIAIGVSGDGDTGSIGLGQFKHLLRRNVDMVYIIMNNGVYGLTKGQLSATADLGQKLKHKGVNELPPLDLCLEAIMAGCGFVARSFAGDPRQLQELLKAAFSHRGTAVLNVISPCVSFNNGEGSTKSYSWGKEHDLPLHEINFLPMDHEEIRADYEPGTVREVELHDGSVIRLKKTGKEYDPTDRMGAVTLLEEERNGKVFTTGLLYVNEGRQAFAEHEMLVVTPLVKLPDEKLRPSKEALEKINAKYR
ncbi:2-oxoacid:ferredoxin oxidoreductase subunit beta [Geomonas sp. Red32]|uniref:2-oxoacid:ferredoxin oxidoreductase subunit beta n=1 Tax=Geomonas sp. Red32 TaxID=2912856 RepID=UPI00202CBB32|nr:2-oxoacid:ferredoxin oxidoreductase subunit beta [Geomonas sp. Red32]MCM0080282.1 2-oxoacid:ferredoxin oxidoreductase subunit beta [Geomonas sp. Red32]